MKSQLRSMAAIVVLGVFLAGAMAASRWSLYLAHGGDVRARLAAVLSERFGWSVQPGDVHFAGRAVGTQDAVVLAAPAGRPKEVYLVRTRLSGSGRILWMGTPVNISRTPRLSETRVVLHAVRGGVLVAFPVATKGGVSMVLTVDTSGEDPSATANWPWVQRMAAKITNWQETGRFAGLDRQALEFRQPVRLLDMHFDEDGRLRLLVEGDGLSRKVSFDPGAKKVLSGSKLVRFIRTDRGRRPLFNWLVDTIRSISWVGPKKIAMLEVAVFWLRDELRRLGYRLRYGTAIPPTRSTADQTAQEMKAAAKAQVSHPLSIMAGWPPDRIQPIVSGADPLEGRWLALPKDAIKRNAGAPEPLLQTFIHPDPSRPYSTVGILLWDPRQVELHMVAGTKEPVSSTGRRGTGRIPRDGRITRLLAAFNGGFQTLHGDFGMQTNGRLIREPARWAATVATYWDGSLAMGTWEPEPPSVPERIRDFRQNLAPLLEGDRENPLKSKYWGWAVRKYRQKVYIVRSGLCQTREGFGAYFWGKAVSLKSLTRAMKMARCRYGMQMDINFTNASLELYRIDSAAGMRPRPPRHFRVGSGRLVRGLVPGTQTYGFEARSWLPGMYLSPFPRYIRTNWRDFGLLYLRPLLPGKSSPGMTWRTKGLFGSAAFFPPVAALSSTPLDDDAGEQVSVLKVDPSQLSMSDERASKSWSLMLAALRPTDARALGPAVVFERGPRGLVARFLPPGRRPGPDVLALVPGRAFSEAAGLASASRVVALGVSPEGFVCHAMADGPSASALEDVMSRAGCVDAVVLAAPGRKGALWIPQGPGHVGRGNPDWKLFSLSRSERPYWAALFHKGVRPQKVRFGPTKGAYDLIRYAKTLRAQGIDPSSREGRRLMRAKMFELSRTKLGKGRGRNGTRRMAPAGSRP